MGYSSFCCCSPVSQSKKKSEVTTYEELKQNEVFKNNKTRLNCSCCLWLSYYIFWSLIYLHFCHSWWTLLSLPSSNTNQPDSNPVTHSGIHIQQRAAGILDNRVKTPLRMLFVGKCIRKFTQLHYHKLRIMCMMCRMVVSENIPHCWEWIFTHRSGRSKH